MPVGGVSQQVGHNVTNQSKGDLLQIQAKDAVEELNDTEGPLPTGLLQEFLENINWATLRLK